VIMKIGELATACSLPTQTIRYYERRRLLPIAERSPNGYRSYDGSAVDQIQFIQRAQAAGLTLAEITGVIKVRADGKAPCEHVDGLLNDKLAAVDNRIGELRQLRGDLIEQLDRSSRLDPTDCRADEICHILNG
jgi:MerR family mercuric resistance operon transcriptional regulator